MKIVNFAFLSFLIVDCYFFDRWLLVDG